jgi:hypothetical protein
VKSAVVAVGCVGATEVVGAKREVQESVVV